MLQHAASVLIAPVLALFIALPLSAQDAAQVRHAVDRSLPYLEKEGLAWIKNHDCLSCHQVTFMLWSHQEAQARGIALDSKKLSDWTNWSRTESLAQRERLKLTDPALEKLKGEDLPAETLAKLAPLAKKNAVKEADFVKELAKTLSPEELGQHKAGLLKHAAREKGDGGGLDTMGQLLLAGVYAGDGSQDTAFVASTRARILELQQADGSWKPGGQLGRMGRSDAEGTVMTTMWIVLALSEKLDAPSKAGIDRALAFLKNSQPGKTNEWLALRMLVEKKFGSADAAPALLKDLLSRQNPDGGWAWIQGGASDAFATGQVLYALSVSGLPGDPAAVQRARKLLIETQGEDGSWTVPPVLWTSPTTKPERIKRLEPIYRYWGTAWAAIGLLQTLPAKP
jgi:hypothetical protein